MEKEVLKVPEETLLPAQLPSLSGRRCQTTQEDETRESRRQARHSQEGNSLDRQLEVDAVRPEAGDPRRRLGVDGLFLVGSGS